VFTAIIEVVVVVEIVVVVAAVVVGVGVVEVVVVVTAEVFASVAPDVLEVLVKFVKVPSELLFFVKIELLVEINR